MDEYTWENNQQVILMGIRRVGQHLINNSEKLKRLTSLKAKRLTKVGQEIIGNIKLCQESHLEEALNFLIDL